LNRTTYNHPISVTNAIFCFLRNIKVQISIPLSYSLKYERIFRHPVINVTT